VEETMFDPASIQRCDFCKTGRVTTHYTPISFRQRSDKGYILCQAEIPIGVCNRCGSQHWNQDAETIVEDAFQQSYRQKSLNRSGASSV
jgi:hypothetical protein